jgi:hypothetical protein
MGREKQITVNHSVIAGECFHVTPPPLPQRTLAPLPSIRQTFRLQCTESVIERAINDFQILAHTVSEQTSQLGVNGTRNFRALQRVQHE